MMSVLGVYGKFEYGRPNRMVPISDHDMSAEP